MPHLLLSLPLLLADGVKTSLGFGLVMMALLFGLLVVCRPSVRKGEPKKKK